MAQGAPRAGRRAASLLVSLPPPPRPPAQTGPGRADGPGVSRPPPDAGIWAPGRGGRGNAGQDLPPPTRSPAGLGAGAEPGRAGTQTRGLREASGSSQPPGAEPAHLGLVSSCPAHSARQPISAPARALSPSTPPARPPAPRASRVHPGAGCLLSDPGQHPCRPFCPLSGTGAPRLALLFGFPASVSLPCLSMAVLGCLNLFVSADAKGPPPQHVSGVWSPLASVPVPAQSLLLLSLPAPRHPPLVALQDSLSPLSHAPLSLLRARPPSSPTACTGTHLQFMSPQAGVPQGRGRDPGVFNPSLSAACRGPRSPGVSWAAAWGGEACACEQEAQ